MSTHVYRRNRKDEKYKEEETFICCLILDTFMYWIFIYIVVRCTYIHIHTGTKKEETNMFYYIYINDRGPSRRMVNI